MPDGHVSQTMCSNHAFPDRMGAIRCTTFLTASLSAQSDMYSLVLPPHLVCEPFAVRGCLQASHEQGLPRSGVDTLDAKPAASHTAGLWRQSQLPPKHATPAMYDQLSSSRGGCTGTVRWVKK